MLASRRRFLMFAAPAIVAAPSLMRVSAAVLDALKPEPAVLQHVLAIYGDTDGFMFSAMIKRNGQWMQVEALASEGIIITSGDEVQMINVEHPNGMYEVRYT